MVIWGLLDCLMLAQMTRVYWLCIGMGIRRVGFWYVRMFNGKLVPADHWGKWIRPAARMRGIVNRFPE